MTGPGAYVVESHAVRRRSSRPTWDEWKAEVRSDIWDCWEIGRYTTAEEARAAAGSDWSGLCKEDQYGTVYQIEFQPNSGDPDGNDGCVVESHDYWMEMISAQPADGGEDDDEAYEGR